MNEATVHLSPRRTAGAIDPRLFGGFIEHLGRAIYGGIFDPGNPRSSPDGLRRDVMDALRTMRPTTIRYPGGNFVSGYDWRDGVGPPEDRPIRPDFAWKSLDSNQFGTDEFIDFCRRIDVQPMLAVNLGTGSAQLAADLVDYCNTPDGTPQSTLRRRYGRDRPHDVRLWCLGNEMDGPWQIGHCSAEEYAARALDAARAMKRVDPTIQTIAAGSSGDFLPTWLEWDRAILERCWEEIDYISAHRYSQNPHHDTAWFLAEGIEIDRVIERHAAVIDAVRATRNSPHRVHLCFDEWNVWYRARGPEHEHGRWRHAPPLIEEQYTLEDALVCAQYLASFVRHADIVKIACIAQLVNTIAPILTRPDGLLIQPTYWPFVAFAQHARGISLQPSIKAPTYDAHARGQVPVLDAAASYDSAEDRVAIFLINREATQPLQVNIRIDAIAIRNIQHAEQLTGQPTDTNIWQTPNAVKPVAAKTTMDDPATIRTLIPPAGFCTIVTGVDEP